MSPPEPLELLELNQVCYGSGEFRRVGYSTQDVLCQCSVALVGTSKPDIVTRTNIR
jgi:hypothetical protein